MKGLVFLLPVLFGCVMVKAEIPLHKKDGTFLLDSRGRVQTVIAKIKTPGAVCITATEGDYMLSTDPRSDYGTAATMEMIVGIAASLFGGSGNERPEKANPYDTCGFIFEQELAP